MQTYTHYRCPDWALKFQESLQAWTVRSPDLSLQRDGTSSGRALPDYARRRFRTSGSFHIMSTAPPRNVSLFGTWRVAILLWVCSVGPT